MNKLTIKFNDESHRYELQLANAVVQCQEFIDNLECKELQVNEETYKLLYDNRTLLNNKVKEIADTRKQACKSITGDFERDCRELEKMLALASERLTARLNEFKPKPQKDKLITLTIKTTNKKVIEKIKKIISVYGDEVKWEEK